MMHDVANFLVGSKFFFGESVGFIQKDCDILFIMEEWDLPGNTARIVDGEKDMFLYKNKNKREMIEECLSQKDPVTAGKFLVPEFCEYIGATIEDIKVLAPLFDKIDEKHRYEKMIFDFYMQNGGFTLTESQRLAAYEAYKKARPDIYG